LAERSGRGRRGARRDRCRHGPIVGRAGGACGPHGVVMIVARMGIARIIVTTDFSDAASAGFERGLAIAARHDAELVVLHVCGAGPTMATAAEAVLGGSQALARMHQIRREQSEKLLERAVCEAKSRHPKVRGLFREGPAA